MTTSEPARRQVPSDYAVNKAFKARLRRFENRGGVMCMHIREFLTIEEPVGRDLQEAINNIDKFDLQEDFDLLRKMQVNCSRRQAPRGT